MSGLWLVKKKKREEYLNKMTGRELFEGGSCPIICAALEH